MLSLATNRYFPDTCDPSPRYVLARQFLPRPASIWHGLPRSARVTSNAFPHSPTPPLTIATGGRHSHTQTSIPRPRCELMDRVRFSTPLRLPFHFGETRTVSTSTPTHPPWRTAIGGRRSHTHVPPLAVVNNPWTRESFPLSPCKAWSFCLDFPSPPEHNLSTHSLPHSSSSCHLLLAFSR